MQSGVHFIVDLLECNLQSLVPSSDAMEEFKIKMLKVVAASGLKELGNHFHYFGPGAVTGVVCLSESHLSFHTWPEKGYATLDLFMCGETQHQDAKAETVISFFAREVFCAEQLKVVRLERPSMKITLQTTVEVTESETIGGTQHGYLGLGS